MKSHKQEKIMNNTKIKSINKNNFKKIDLDGNFIAWSKIGNGTITFLRKELESLNFYVFEIRPYQHDFKTFDPELKEKLESIRDNNKRIAFVFDEISNSNSDYADAFQEAVINNQFNLFHIYDRDVVIGAGRINADESLAEDKISKDVLACVDHYKLGL
jgi:hypothetical protein